jgi:hypothetical protein
MAICCLQRLNQNIVIFACLLILGSQSQFLGVIKFFDLRGSARQILQRNQKYHIGARHKRWMGSAANQIDIDHFSASPENILPSSSTVTSVRKSLSC